MKISVTRDDIGLGLPDDPATCPVALAATRAFGCQAYVTKEYIHIPRGGKWPFYALPKPAGDWVVRFDRGQPVEPFEFEASEQWQPDVRLHFVQD